MSLSPTRQNQTDLSEFTLSDSDGETGGMGDIDADLPSDLFSSPEPTTLPLRRRDAHEAAGNQTTHTNSVLKVELSQKNLVIQQLKAELHTKEEESKDIIEELQNKVNLLQRKLESDLLIQRNDSQRRQSDLRKELDAAQSRHRQLQDQNQQLLSQAGQIKRMFQGGDLVIEEEEYQMLKLTKRDSELGVRDFLICKLHETMQPLKFELADTKRHMQLIEEERDRLCQEIDDSHQELDKERQIHHALQLDYQKLLKDLNQVQERVQSGNYKIENFDRIMEEREHFESLSQSLQDQLAALQIDWTNATRDRDDVYHKFTDTSQKLTLLLQDKDYLTKKITELTQRSGLAEEKYEQACKQVEDLQKARENLYDKYVTARDQYKQQYENQLRDEVDKLRLKTDHEIERLKVGTRDLFEKEALSLREQRDAALAAHDKCSAHARDLEVRLDRQRQEMLTLQTTQDNRVAELLSQCKVRSFEAERTGLLYEETKNQLQHALDETDKLRSKVDTVTKEFYQLEANMSKRVSSLTHDLTQCQQQLRVYEKLEDELDQAVIQAAELASNDSAASGDYNPPNAGDLSVTLHAEKILHNYGSGGVAAIPSMTKRRMRQSVELARRVLQLERMCAGVQKENSQLEAKLQESGDELKRVNQILNDAQQPYGYLIDSLRSRDALIQKHQATIKELQEKLRMTKQERAQMIKNKNEMAKDLEKLLGQREELAMLRQLVESMRMQQPSPITLAHRPHNNTSQTTAKKPSTAELDSSKRVFGISIN